MGNKALGINMEATSDLVVQYVEESSDLAIRIRATEELARLNDYRARVWEINKHLKFMLDDMENHGGYADMIPGLESLELGSEEMMSIVDEVTETIFKVAIGVHDNVCVVIVDGGNDNV